MTPMTNFIGEANENEFSPVLHNAQSRDTEELDGDECDER